MHRSLSEEWCCNCESELLNIFLLGYLGWCRPETLSANMLWRLRENQWDELWEGVTSRCFQLEVMRSLQVNSASHTFSLEMTSFILNHHKLLCLQSVSSTLVWPLTHSGMYHRNVRNPSSPPVHLPVHHNPLSTISPCFSSSCIQHSAFLSKQDSAWANS